MCDSHLSPVKNEQFVSCSNSDLGTVGRLDWALKKILTHKEYEYNLVSIDSNEKGCVEVWKMRIKVSLVALLVLCSYAMGTEPLIYGERISQKVFVDFENNKIGFPGARKYSLCFFIKGSDLDLERLNKLLSFSYPDENLVDVYVCFQNGIQARHVPFVGNWQFNFVSVEENRDENENFFSRVCGTCFSMLVLEGDQVKFFHSGFDLHYFSEMLQQLK